MKPTSRPNGEAASANITKRIQELGDWRGETLAHIRQLIHEADPDIQEEWKWVKPANPGVPVWSHDGIVCTGESYKQVVKLTFARGASIEDPKKLFNSSLEGNMRRAIDLREGDGSTKRRLSNSSAPQWRPTKQHALSGQAGRIKPGSGRCKVMNGLSQQKGEFWKTGHGSCYDSKHEIKTSLARESRLLRRIIRSSIGISAGEAAREARSRGYCTDSVCRVRIRRPSRTSASADWQEQGGSDSRRSCATARLLQGRIWLRGSRAARLALLFDVRL